MAAAPPVPRGPARRPDGARARDPPAHRARAHQRRDRRPALPHGAHHRVPPRPRPAEAAAPRGPSWCATRSTTPCWTTRRASEPARRAHSGTCGRWCSSAGRPLRPPSCPCPEPGPGELLIRVRACGVCRTDLHVVDGELPTPHCRRARARDRRRRDRERHADGERVGVPWLGWTCGDVPLLPQRAREPLRRARASPATRSTAATPSYALADARFCFPLPDGYRRRAGRAAAVRRPDRLPRAAHGRRRASGSGSTASAPRRTSSRQVAAAQGRRVFAFTRAGDDAAQAFARELGAAWAGDSDERAARAARRGDHLRAGRRARAARRCGRVGKGGTVVCAGIHMSDIPSFPYADLWGERVLRSVANLTRRDGEEFLRCAARAGPHDVTRYPLARRTMRWSRSARRADRGGGGPRPTTELSRACAPTDT